MDSSFLNTLHSFSSSIYTAWWGPDSHQSKSSPKNASEKIQSDVAVWMQRSWHTEHSTVPHMWSFILGVGRKENTGRQKRKPLFFLVLGVCVFGKQPPVLNILSCLSSINHPHLSGNNLQSYSCLLTVYFLHGTEFSCWNKGCFLHSACTLLSAGATRNTGVLSLKFLFWSLL